MPHMSSEQLRDLSIRVVEGFLNDKVPLSEGLAKQAAANDLNSDQVQRCVEACNTISFLKIMGAAQDRTFEFPLCDYNDVMGVAAAPNLTKVASLQKTIPQPDPAGLTKQASFEDTPSEGSGFCIREQTLFMIKEAAANSRALDELECRSVQLLSALTKTASVVRQDPAALDKMACAVDLENTSALTTLVFGKPEAVRDFGAGAAGMFKQAELKAIATLQDLYKEARLVRDELNSRRALHERAQALQGELTKQAFAPAFAAGRLLGSAAGSAASGLGRIASKPIRSLASGTVNATKRTFGIGTPTPKSTAAKVVGGAGTLGLNSMMIDASPGVTSSGRSRDVWEALQ